MNTQTQQAPARLSLYGMGIEYRNIMIAMEDWAIEHEGDITEFPLNDALFHIQDSMETKALTIALMYKEAKTFGDSIIGQGAPFADLARDYAERGRAHLNRAERLKEYLRSVLPLGTKYENEHARVTTQNNGGVETVQVLEGITVNDFPVEFHKVVDPVLDTDKVRESAVVEPGWQQRVLKAGDTVLAWVFRGYHVRIK